MDITSLIPAIILAAWWYDPMLLVKARNRVVKPLVTHAVRTYHTVSDGCVQKADDRRNDMMKPGLHVDFVYLHNRNIKYDITSTFRAQLLSGAFDRVPLLDFLETCCTANTNLRTIDRETYYRLEIRYTFDYNPYVINFDTEVNDRLKFPMFSEEDTREILATQEEPCKILSATIACGGRETDFTEEMLRMGGPLNDFYFDHEIEVLKKWIPREWVPFNSIERLDVIDSSGVLHTIGDGCISTQLFMVD